MWGGFSNPPPPGVGGLENPPTHSGNHIAYPHRMAVSEPTRPAEIHEAPSQPEVTTHSKRTRNILIAVVVIVIVIAVVLVRRHKAATAKAAQAAAANSRNRTVAVAVTPVVAQD